MEEYIDFVVIEIDFEKMNFFEVIVWSENKDVSNIILNKDNKDEFIKVIINDY